MMFIIIFVFRISIRNVEIFLFRTLLLPCRLEKNILLDNLDLYVEIMNCVIDQKLSMTYTKLAGVFM